MEDAGYYDSSSIQTTQTEDEESASARESDAESEASSALQWQDDPEFQNKVRYEVKYCILAQ